MSLRDITIVDLLDGLSNSSLHGDRLLDIHSESILRAHRSPDDRFD